MISNFYIYDESKEKSDIVILAIAQDREALISLGLGDIPLPIDDSDLNRRYFSMCLTHSILVFIALSSALSLY